jgi:single-strand DNA-binding protein
MENVNRVELIGNLVAEPELKYLPSGAVLAKLRIATNKRFRDKNGTPQKRTQFHRLQCWGERAEFAKKHLSRGMFLRMIGELETNEFKDAEGNTRYDTHVAVSHIGFMSPKPGMGDEMPAGPDGDADGEGPTYDGGTEPGQTGDDIAF